MSWIAVFTKNGENPNYQAYKESFTGLSALKDDINGRLLKVKGGIVQLQKNFHLRAGRKLPESESEFEQSVVGFSAFRDDIDRVKDSDRLVDLTAFIKAKLPKLKGFVEFIKLQKPNFNFKESKVVRNVNELYTQTFELIDLYGQFYVMTNRIWITSDNIYRLFKARADETNNEIEMNHFARVQQQGERLRLLTIGFHVFVENCRWCPSRARSAFVHGVFLTLNCATGIHPVTPIDGF